MILYKIFSFFSLLPEFGLDRTLVPFYTSLMVYAFYSRWLRLTLAGQKTRADRLLHEQARTIVTKRHHPHTPNVALPLVQPLTDSEEIRLEELKLRKLFESSSGKILDRTEAPPHHTELLKKEAQATQNTGRLFEKKEES